MAWFTTVKTEAKSELSYSLSREEVGMTQLNGFRRIRRIGDWGLGFANRTSLERRPGGLRS